jgi:quercetin dioxygenase-like cupin family protein
VSAPARPGDDAPKVEVQRAAGPPRRAEVERGLRAEGLTPRPWSNGPHVSYDRHEHEHHKVLLCVSGSIIFHTDAGDVALAAGDRMELPRGVEHGATVGADGVECVEAYRH